MNKSKLLGLLKTLNSKELRAFKDFIESPYFNKQKELVTFYLHLKKCATKDFPPAKLERTYVFNIIYPNMPYDDKTMNYLMSQLLKLAEKFIGLRKIEQTGILSDCYTLYSYTERRLAKQYKHILNRAKSKLEDTQKRDEAYYYQKYLVTNIAALHYSQQNIRQFDTNLQEAADNLDIFYLTQKMKFLCAMLDRQKYVSQPYQPHLLEEAKQAIEQGIYKDVPGISIYYTLFQTLTEEDSDQYFFKFKELIFQHGQQFSAEEMTNLYYFSINYCIQKIRVGKKNFAAELMQLYQDGLEKEYLLVNGTLSPWTFKNMAKLGLGLGRYDWVEQFVRDNTQKLPEQVRADAIHFNLADLNYHKKDFEQALIHLNKVEFTDIHYNLGAKAMLLKIYYETQTTEAFLSLVSSFKQYINRNNHISKNVKVPYLNFVNLTHQLFKYGQQNPEMVLQKIKDTTMLSDRSWLINQIAKNEEQ